MATRTALGTATNKALSGTTWSALTGITLDPNETLLIGLAAISSIGASFQAKFPDVGTNAPADIFPDGVSPRLNIFRYRNLTIDPITGNITLVAPAGFDEAYGMVAVKYNVLLGKDATATDNGTGAAADSGNAVTPTASEQVLWGITAVQGPGGDGAPSITAGSEVDNLGQRAGTTGGSDTGNCTIVEAYGSITSAANVNAAITLATSRAWMASVIRYVVLPNAGGGPYSDVHCVG